MATTKPRESQKEFQPQINTDAHGFVEIELFPCASVLLTVNVFVSCAFLREHFEQRIATKAPRKRKREERNHELDEFNEFKKDAPSGMLDSCYSPDSWFLASSMVSHSNS